MPLEGGARRRATERRRLTELPPEYQDLKLERAVLIGLSIGGRVAEAEEHLAELARLTDTAGAEVVHTLLQRRDRPDSATFLGKGKAAEVTKVVKALGADTVVVDEELSPGQLRNLEEIVGCKVIDRTALIIDIFAQHAHTAEGKLQVELAQLNYLLPRLRGWGEALSRQAATGQGRTGRALGGGGIGTRGPGETKIEIDRRRIQKRLVRLRKELADVERVRKVKRSKRARVPVPSVALVGYTNAGKSTLLNALTDAGVLVQDQLFSTLDATTRRLDLPDGRTVTMTDTVGFVRKLPHMLVEAFKSTLEETVEADLLVHVIDGSVAEPRAQYDSVREVLADVGSAHVPELIVLNKLDLLDEVGRARVRRYFEGAVLVSAARGEGLDEFLTTLATSIPQPLIEVELLVPYDRGDVVAALHAAGAVLAEDFIDGGTRVRARVRADQAGRLQAYRVEPTEWSAHP